MKRTLENFVTALTLLSTFLCMQDEDLKNLGIEFPLDCMRILRGLLNFHLNHWSKKGLTRVTRYTQENTYDILMIIGNQMQHVIIIQSTIKYVQNNIDNNVFDAVYMKYIEDLEQILFGYRKALKSYISTNNKNKYTQINNSTLF